MDDYRSKIMALETLIGEIHRLKSQGRKIVFTNGCFDILHPGPTRYLWQARQLGDYLVVAVNSDRSARILKGPGRPVVPQAERTEILAGLACVDQVVVFGSRTVVPVIRALRPDVQVKGTDYSPETIPEADEVRSYGGRVAVAGDPKDHSTTDLLARLRRLLGRPAGGGRRARPAGKGRRARTRGRGQRRG
jgi:rfaE bifunctional protein nucleotidyltransferase chain/domain